MKEVRLTVQQKQYLVAELKDVVDNCEVLQTGISGMRKVLRYDSQIVINILNVVHDGHKKSNIQQGTMEKVDGRRI